VENDVFNGIKVTIPYFNLIRERGRPGNKSDEPAIGITIQTAIDFIRDGITKVNETK
jgi:hypothetical protein